MAPPVCNGLVPGGDGPSRQSVPNPSLFLFFVRVFPAVFLFSFSHVNFSLFRSRKIHSDIFCKDYIVPNVLCGFSPPGAGAAVCSDSPSRTASRFSPASHLELHALAAIEMGHTLRRTFACTHMLTPCCSSGCSWGLTRCFLCWKYLSM